MTLLWLLYDYVCYCYWWILKCTLNYFYACLLAAAACKMGGGCFINIKAKRENLLLRVFSGWFNFIQDENYGYGHDVCLHACIRGFVGVLLWWKFHEFIIRINGTKILSALVSYKGGQNIAKLASKMSPDQLSSIYHQRRYLSVICASFRHDRTNKIVNLSCVTKFLIKLF